MKKKIAFSVFIGLFILAAAGFFYFRQQVYFSHGKGDKEMAFEIKKGEGNGIVAARLAEEGLILDKIYFYYYMKLNKLTEKILPGVYKLSGKMTIPEIARAITSQQDLRIRITFPEGWDSKKMAARMSENGLPGEDFLAQMKDVDKFRPKYDFLGDSKIKSLEGYLFPDTYFFPNDADGEKIIKLMLNNFGEKVSQDIRQDIEKQRKTLFSIVTMASLLELEVKSQEDREVVSGIFWDRISQEMPLQNCATLAYALGVPKKQYSYEDTQFKSPYNTYLNKNLPPGPIGNPGLVSITAAAYPKETPYLYFLTDPKTGQTLFAKTFEEQNANKDKCGL